jgi:hypothetical protein
MLRGFTGKMKLPISAAGIKRIVQMALKEGRTAC